MWIVRLALRRPYTFVVAALVLLLLTPLVMWRTPTDIFPAINIPVISVIWQYQGLSAQEIEQRILFNHERSLSATVNDIEHVESTSYNGVGIIKVFLREGTSVDAGVSQVTAIAQTILRQLPPGQTPPLVIRYNASTVPILQYGLSSKTLSEQELYDLGQNQVRVGLSTIQGAQVPWPYGGRTRNVSVDLDLTALKSKNLKAEDVVNAFAAQSLILPSGTMKVGATEYDIALNSQPRILDELNNLPVKVINGATIRVRDVAQVRDGYLPQQNVVRQDGQRGALLTILKSGSASTLDVIARVKDAMPNILATLTPELEVKEFADQSIFVRSAINGVAREGTIAAALTAAMILLFLGSWRSTFIIALSIPLSVLASLATLSALGETINLMTLGGLALAVGILVDDATVEIENIHRQMALGKPLQQAILDGAQEIALPAFVSTLCICVVFVPMFFLTGVARHLFVPLAEAVVFAMLASYILSRTLIPTLVMWFYRHAEHYSVHHGHALDDDWQTGGTIIRKREVARGPRWLRPFTTLQIGFERGFGKFRTGYRSLLATLLHHPIAFGALFLAFCAGSWLMFPHIGQDFFPVVDAGQIRLHLRARTGTRIEETVRLVDRVEQAIREVIPNDEIAGILDNSGIPNSGISLSYSNNGLIGTGDADVLVSLRPEHGSTPGYVRQLRERLNRDFPGTIFYFLPADIVSQTINFGLPAPLDIQIVGRDLAKNRELAGRLAERIRHVPGAVDVRVQQRGDLPRFQVDIDREKSAEIGLTERDVANSVLLSLSGSGQVAPSFWLNSKNGIQYGVNVRAPERALDSIESLASIPVSASTNGSGDGQVLANLASITRTNAPAVISHYNVAPVIDVFGGADGRDLGSVLREVEPLVEQARRELPRGSSIVMRGQVETMKSSYQGLLAGLGGAIVLVYLLLVVNFQSWTDPFVIITALPGAVAGVAWGLWVTNTTVSVPALMGSIMCIGVATANSVLVVSFAREAMHRGRDVVAAALEAGSTRLRAVLMTALAMMLGMVPMSLGFSEGGEQNAPLGRAVIGGLFFATLGTLLFVPIVFTLVHRQRASTAPMPENPPTELDEMIVIK